MVDLACQCVQRFNYVINSTKRSWICIGKLPLETNALLGNLTNVLFID